MNRQDILERERRWRPLVIVASILPLIFLIGGVALQSSGGTDSDLATESLRTINANAGSRIAGSAILALSFLSLSIPLIYLFRAAQARAERMLGGLMILAVLGPVLFGAQFLLSAIGQVDVADKFISQEEGVGDIYSLANNLFENSGAFTAAAVISSVATIALIFAMVYTPLWAVRVGLLTRFHGTLGMALGASFILPPLTGITLPALLAWFMYFGFLLWGRTPKGRPPAWDAGTAVPWPAPGEEAAVATAGGGDIVDGDATQIPGVGENPNAARRERAKKRKRKRRN